MNEITKHVPVCYGLGTIVHRGLPYFSVSILAPVGGIDALSQLFVAK